MKRAMWIACAMLMLAGCTSTGTLGLVTKSGTDGGAVLRDGRPYRDIGPARGESCRYFLLAIVPWGDGTFASAVNEALSSSGGDALLNVTVSNSLYGFIPIYNVFTYQCTTVAGTAIKFEPRQQENAAPAPRSSSLATVPGFDHRVVRHGNGCSSGTVVGC